MATLPYQYLGAPIHYKKLSAIHFDHLLRKIETKVSGWKGKLLSSGGKLTLLQSVMSALPLHVLYVLKPPMSIIHRIEQAFAHFFWGDKGGKRLKIWIKWATISRPKEEGELGLRDLKEMMAALHGKLGWII